ncbi:phytochelatin synthase family protein [Massilia sp. W12]|uniref:phytochelatin synthase family protein n=1 Tax=Massilia sp. W12 TaxID=3126507 RepID=UPI0030CE2F28
MICKAKPHTQTESGFYKRALPAQQISFSSDSGRTLFQEALLAGGMRNFFPLIEQFHTQAEPSYCGISSLVMVLNALQVDPKRLWKGVWRWYSEEIADCCQQLQAIEKDGISLHGLAGMARCNGLAAECVHADASGAGLQQFRQLVQQVCHGARPDGSPCGADELPGRALLAAYSRAALGQTGDGHFSPIGGYHAGRDLVLLLDVARFKYPPHWVALSDLWQAMQYADSQSGMARGYMLLAVEPSDSGDPC